MTNGANLFLFISQFRNYETLLDHADTNNDGVLTKDEMGDLLRDSGINYTANQFNAFWTQLDTFQSGDIKRGVRDLNALNATEAANLEQKMVAYGKIYDALDSAVPAVFIKVSYYANQVNMTQDDLKELAAGYMVNNGAIELANNNPSALGELAKKCACKAACDLIKEGFLKDDGVLGNAIKNSVADDYSLSHDRDLTTLIESYIQNTDCTDINAIGTVVQTLKRIIQAYIQTAGLQPGWAQYTEGLDSQYKYDQSHGLNALQNSVIDKKIADTIKCSDYKSSLNVNYSGFEGLFNQVLKAWQNSLTGDFNTIKSSITKAKFEESDGYKGLKAFADILNNLGDNCNSGGGNHMSGILRFFAGIPGGESDGSIISGSSLAKIINSDAFKEIVAGVLQDYLDDPNSISIPDSEDNLQVGFENEILKRVKENLDTLLAAAGITSDKDVEDILYNNTVGTEVLTEKPHYGNYDDEDVKESAHIYLQWVVELAQRDSATKEAIESISVGGIDYDFSSCIPAGLMNQDVDTIMKVVDAVHNAINGVVGTGDDGNINNNNNNNNNNNTQTSNIYVDVELPEIDYTGFDNNVTDLGSNLSIAKSERDSKTAALKEQLKAWAKNLLQENSLAYAAFKDLFNKICETAMTSSWDANLQTSHSNQGNGYNQTTSYTTYKINWNNYATDFVNSVKTALTDKVRTIVESEDLTAQYQAAVGTDTEAMGGGLVENFDDFGIPENDDFSIVSGNYDITKMTAGTVFYDIACVGYRLYDAAKHNPNISKEQAFAAFQTFLSYYRGALLAVKDFDKWDDRHQGYFISGTVDYHQYSKDGQKTQQSASGNTYHDVGYYASSFNTWGAMSGQDGWESSSQNIPSDDTGLRIGRDKKGNDKGFYVYLDMEVARRKFQEFLNAAV